MKIVRGRCGHDEIVHFLSKREGRGLRVDAEPVTFDGASRFCACTPRRRPAPSLPWGLLAFPNFLSFTDVSTKKDEDDSYVM